MQERIAAVQSKVAAAAERSGREASDVRILAVTKTHPAQTLIDAMEHGLLLLGENRVQEAQEKMALIVEQTDVRPKEFHLIGHLQRNKAKLVPGLFDWVQSIDSVKLAEALSRRCEEASAHCQILLELNSSGEDSKFGFRNPDMLLDGASEIAELPGLTLRGVMTIAPFVSDESVIRRSFELTRETYGRMQQSFPELPIDTLSMGMTDDYEIAIEEGSTMVRVGRAFFGERSS